MTALGEPDSLRAGSPGDTAVPTRASQLALVTDRWDDRGGGREQYLLDLTSRLRAGGCRIHVLCRRVGEGVSERVTVHRRAQTLETTLVGWRAKRPDVPILASRPLAGATHYQLHAGLYAEAFAAEAETYDSKLRQALFRPAQSLNRPRAATLRAEEKILSGPERPRLMVWSRALRDALVRSYGILPEEIRVSVPGVNLSLFHPPGGGVRGAFGQDSGDLRLLFAAHNFRLKGLGTALRALRETQRLGLRARLLVAGGGPVHTFRRMARKLGVEPGVEFLGIVPRRRLADLYRECDVLVHPTFYDPCSLAVLEALASGCPVITTRRNGACEIFDAGREGFVLEDPRDSSELARLLGLLADSRRSMEMRAVAADRGRGLSLNTHVAEVAGWLGLASATSSSW